MKKFFAFIIFVLLMLSFLIVIFVSCTKINQNGSTDETDFAHTEENPLTSSDGDLRFTALGIEKYDTYGGKTASDGNKIFVLYIEIKNDSEVRKYLHKSYFDYRFSDNEIEIENYPDGYTEAEGFIESGMRKKTVIAFEYKDNWKFFDIEYTPIWYSSTSFLKYCSASMVKVSPKIEFYRESCGSGIACGDDRFPVDTNDYSFVTEQFMTYYKNLMFGEARNVDEGMRLLDTIKVSEQGGYWEDINYEEGADGQPYPEAHLYRIRCICTYLGEDGLAALSDENKEKINLAIEFWLNGNYRLEATEEAVIAEKEQGIAADYNRTNWSYNDFHTPRRIFPILIMFGDYIKAETAERILLQSPHCLFPENDIYWRANMTASNLFNMLRNSLYYAAYKGDIGMACSVAEHFSSNIYLLSEDGKRLVTDTYTQDGGIAPDGSIYQHEMAYGAGYGVDYTECTADILNALGNGLSIEPDNSAVDILSYYVTTSYKMTQRGLYGNMTLGRAIATYTPGGYHDSCLNVLASSLLQFDNCTRKDELRYILDNYYTNECRCENNASAYYFHNALISSMKTENVTMLARGARNDTVIYEANHDINCLCRNLRYGGLTEFLYTGKEYAGIASLWDWSLIPGTTAFYESDEELRAWSAAQNGLWLNLYPTDGTYCDGTSDDKASAVYVGVVNEEGLTALKTDISYNGITVCLGADITCTSKDNKKVINTSVEQCYYSDATYNGEDLYNSEIEIADDTAVKNGAFAYYNIGDGNMLAKVESKTSHLRRVYLSSYSDPETSGDIFTVWFNHGTGVKGGEYAYAVADNSNGDAPERGSELPIEQITNTKDIQAVEFEDGTVVAVFHDTSKTLTTTDGRTISGTDSERAVIAYK